MPIIAEKKKLYPEDWDEIALQVKEDADWKCDKCGQPHDTEDMSHCLTVHHQDRNPANCSRDNLVALCAKCHLREEAMLKMEERDKCRGQQYLF